MHDYFVDEQARLRRLPARSVMPALILDLDRAEGDVLDAAYEFWLRA